GGHDPIEILAGLDGESPLLLVAGPQTALDLAAHALQRRGGDDGLGGATDAEQHVDLLVVLGGGDGGGDVTVPEDGDSGTDLAHLVDVPLIPVPVEDEAPQLAEILAPRLGDATQVLGDGGLEIDAP